MTSTTTYITNGKTYDEHPVFGPLPVVSSHRELGKTDRAIVSMTYDNEVTMDVLAGPATHFSEIVGYIEVKGKPNYLIVRDDVYRRNYRLKAIDAFIDPKLSGLYSSPEKAVQAVVG